MTPNIFQPVIDGREMALYWLSAVYCFFFITSPMSSNINKIGREEEAKTEKKVNSAL